jgi:peptide/nickel transport system permease protein
MQRLAAIAVLAVVMSILVFAATHLLPGSAAVMILGEYATPDAVAALGAKLHLDDPLVQQYGDWLSGILSGNFGDSLVMERPVAPLVAEALGNSAILAVAAMICVTLLGLTTGVIGALREGRAADHALAIVSYVGISVPEFFWAVVFVLLFGAALGWLPTNGTAPLSDGLWPFLSHLVMPVATLTLGLMCHVARQTRASMITVLQSDYVKAARARGLPERTVVLRHALPSGLLPSITVLAHDFGVLIGGIVVVETVFSYPGIGRLLVFALEHHDLPLMQAIILTTTVLFALINLVADLLYSWADPRIRFGRAVG